MTSNRNTTHFTVHRAESVVPAVGGSLTSDIYWIYLDGSETSVTLHFKDLASIIDWTAALTTSAIAMMAEVVAARTPVEISLDNV